MSRRFVPFYEKELEKVISDCWTILDLGCGPNSPIRYFSSGLFSVGIDCFQPSIRISKTKCIHSDYICTNVFNALDSFLPESFDCVVALDLIEHLRKEDGFRLIEKMDGLAKKLVVIFTTNGYVAQGAWNDNPWQVHRSGWTTSEFNKMGFTVTGVNGLRSLRGEFSHLKYKPKRFWMIISDITQMIVKNHPEYAFQLLGYKRKNVVRKELRLG